MEFVRAHGYPVPEVFDVSDDGSALVMERVGGPTMVDRGAARPWRIRSLGRELAALHQSLHDLPTPDWLAQAPLGSGDRLLHMDLHPLNVLMGADGPMVIDWTNAAIGDPLVDVALTWALIASGDLPTGGVRSAVLGVGRGLLLDAFLKPFEGPGLTAMLVDAVEWKTTDQNLTAPEVGRMRSLLDDRGTGTDR